MVNGKNGSVQTDVGCWISRVNTKGFIIIFILHPWVYASSFPKKLGEKCFFKPRCLCFPFVRWWLLELKSIQRKYLPENISRIKSLVCDKFVGCDDWSSSYLTFCWWTDLKYLHIFLLVASPTHSSLLKCSAAVSISSHLYANPLNMFYSLSASIRFSFSLCGFSIFKFLSLFHVLASILWRSIELAKRQISLVNLIFIEKFIRLWDGS